MERVSDPRIRSLRRQVEDDSRSGAAVLARSARGVRLDLADPSERLAFGDRMNRMSDGSPGPARASAHSNRVISP